MPVAERPQAPAFLVIGSQRAGTTWLHEYLASLGSVGLPQGVKETFFFDRQFERGPGWYLGHFSGAAQPRGEIAPTYLHSLEAPARVRETLGTVKLACLLRDPAERSFSLYLHEQRKGRIEGGFWEAVRQQPEIVESSYYGRHLDRWLQFFAPENLRIFFQEDLDRDPEAFVREFCGFIGIDAGPVPEMLRARVNEGSVPTNRKLAKLGSRSADLLRRAGLYSAVNLAKRAGLKQIFFGREGNNLPRLGTGDRERLVGMFRRDIELVERLSGRALPGWKQA
ncbi:MAG TPA: sulfotransferase domain-containing protein [Solimonas sp.]|nr:sulfotransferase domain-containing protein [Solimonas sp.]